MVNVIGASIKVGKHVVYSRTTVSVDWIVVILSLVVIVTLLVGFVVLWTRRSAVGPPEY
ncbi:MAG TPA: hypothetical protein VK277_03510 [Acidimicrobiales bacterium]|nr:hypothetical protein [Acidimicrobiales bacterium]